MAKITESKRDRVKDILCNWLVETYGFADRQDVYEDVCDVADLIFDTLGISPASQDRP
jgi:hypothetical protein